MAGRPWCPPSPVTSGLATESFRPVRGPDSWRPAPQLLELKKTARLQGIFSTGVQGATVETRLRGLICDDDRDGCRAVGAVMDRCGFDVVAIVQSTSGAIRAARRTKLHVVVLDLAVTGELGLRVVPHLAQAVPGVAVIVLSPFEALKEDAVAVGAYDLFDPSDLRLLEGSLHAVASRYVTRDVATA